MNRTCIGQHAVQRGAAMTLSQPKDMPLEDRFRFGQNWSKFLGKLDDERIAEAVRSLQEWLGVQDLSGRRFLDIGCGSGLFSLAARRLGARVHSFDFDPDSVACAHELRRRYYPEESDWTIERGSVLDKQFMSGLGQHDVVYSWGVLHHTGHMWEALENASGRIAADGLLFIAIYNDQGRASKRWKAVKRVYVSSPKPVKSIMLAGFLGRVWGRPAVMDLFTRGNPLYTWRNYKSLRGMSAWNDLVDWIGGYPFEVAKPEEIFEFLRLRGFELNKIKTCGGGLGCNEFVFRKTKG